MPIHRPVGSSFKSQYFCKMPHKIEKAKKKTENPARRTTWDGHIITSTTYIVCCQTHTHAYVFGESGFISTKLSSFVISRSRWAHHTRRCAQLSPPQ